MSGEIFFDFSVKPVKKRKSQSGSKDDKQTQDEESLEESRGEKKKHHRKLDEDIWERTDYAKANAMDKLGFYEGGQQNEVENESLTNLKKSRQGRKERKRKSKSKRRHRSRSKERKEKVEQDSETDDEDVISWPPERSDEEEIRERKKRRKRRKKKRSAEQMGLDVSDGRHRTKAKKKRRPSWQQNADIEVHDDKDDTIELSESRGPGSTPVGSPMVPAESMRFEDNTRTARCTSSLESVVTDELFTRKSPVNYGAMYNRVQEPISSETELIVELRYWAVLALFIFLLLIYRAFLPPIQCDTGFKQ